MTHSTFHPATLPPALPSVPIPPFLPEILSPVARLSHPITSRNLRAANKAHRKAISNHDLLLSEVYWRYIDGGFDNLWEWAVRRWHPEVLTAFVGEAEDEQQEDMLLAAANVGDLDMVLLLINEAAGKGHMAIVEALIGAGADLYAGMGKAPASAVEHRQPRVLERMLELTPNVWPDLYDAIDMPIENSDLECVRICIAHGVDVNQGEVGPEELLQKAVARDNLQIVEALVGLGVDVHYAGSRSWGYILHEAIDGAGNIEIIQYLLDRGVNIHLWNEQAMITAVRKGRVDIVRMLLRAGADDGGYQERVVHRAIQYGDRAMLDVLTQAGVDVPTHLRSFIEDALCEGFTGQIDLVIRMGIDIRATGVLDDWTVWQWTRACKKGHFDVIRCLLLANIVPTDDCDFIKLFVRILEAGQSEILDLLVRTAKPNSELIERALERVGEGEGGARAGLRKWMMGRAHSSDRSEVEL
ncbi:hypothetical protein HDV00_006719 [Rhizophlyctis rosea]|nr:hypothetical protein HDV00_006719 [Rhizophlyctis rosea]